MKKIYIFFTLIILGLIGNILNTEMFFGVNQIFGSVFVLLAAWYFGPLIGTLAAVIIQSYTIYLWGHPYALMIFTLEALVVGLLLRKRISNIFIADFIYWIILGAWLVPLFYGNMLGLSDTQVILISLKQVTNGILNALLATIISLFIIKYLNKDVKISLREIIFAIMITIVSFSLYISANIITKNKFEDIENKIIIHLTEIGVHLNEELEDYINNSISEVNHLIDMHYLNTSHIKLSNIEHIYSVNKKNELTFIPTDQNNEIKNHTKLLDTTCTNIPTIYTDNTHFQINIKNKDLCIIASLKKDSLSKFLIKQSYTSGLESSIIKDNIIITSSNKTLLNTSLIGTLKHINKDSYHLLPDKKMPKMLKWKKSFYVHTIDNKYFPNYQIVLTQSFASSIDELQKVYIFIFIILLTIIAISTFIVYFTSMIILKPIFQLTENTANLPKKIVNQENISWPQTNITEIMDLSTNFDILTKTLTDIFKENAERYEKIIEGSQDLLLVVSIKDSSIKNFNSVSSTVFGDKLNIMGDIKAIINDTVQNIYHILEKDSNNTFWLKDKDENHLPVKITLQFINIDNEELVIIHIKDITKEVKAIEQLKLIEKVFKTTTEGIIITDASKNIIMVNNGFTNITGYNEDDVIGKSPNVLSSQWQDKSFYNDMTKELEKNNKWQGELWNRKKDGTLYVEWINIYRLLDEQGNTLNYIGIFIDITEKKESQDKINQLAYYDTLTSLPNRALFEDRIAHAITNAKRMNTIIALMFIDLDNFKIVNDTLGHDAGDKLLKEVSQRIKKVIRENDTLSRIGGDEFTLILENIRDKSYILGIAKKIINTLNEPFILENKETFTSASIGICVYPDDTTTISGMMQKADTAMYRVKELGKNSFEFYTQSMNDDAVIQLEIINNLKRAIDEKQLELYYQPKINFETNKIEGVEALIRWIDKDNKFISPEIFIPIAEKSGLMGQIEDFVLKTGARQQALWIQKGININVALNISDNQFRKSTFVKDTLEIFKNENINPRTIELELTERIVMDSEESYNNIQALKDVGFDISLDDFGTGQSSLSYLKKYNIDKLKIDKSFIDDLPNDEQSVSIARAIVSLAKAMGMKTIAEGVETKEQLEFLKDLGCDAYQGWYFSKAIKAEEFEKLYFET
jgi:diguanylate cyclase (GGDEF)-like protein/PAS domain S-box-containing protein